MKKILSISAVIVMLILCCGCAKRFDPRNMSSGVSNISASVTAEIKEGDSFTEMPKFTLILQNNTENEIVYGTPIALETYIDGGWYSVTAMDDVAWTAIGIILPPHTSSEESVDLGKIYKQLPAGRYRILKDMAGEYAAAEFEITAD